MRILMFGPGVIGHVYGSQLQEAGHFVAIYARPEDAERFPQGLSIRLTDYRKESRDLLDIPQLKHDYSINYRPQYVESFSPQDAWDLIIVAIGSHDLPSALPLLAAGAGDADILFFQNNWTGTTEISKHLSADQYVFGFPEAGGVFDEEGIVGSLYGTVVLGEPDGAFRPRLDGISAAFALAGFQPSVRRDIVPWLWTHYAITAVKVGGAARAGGYSAFVQNSKIVEDAVRATREALAVVRARGVDVAQMDEARLFDLPIWAGVPAFKFLKGKPEASQIADLQVARAWEEMDHIFNEVLATARELKVSVPHLEAFATDVAVMTRKLGANAVPAERLARTG